MALELTFSQSEVDILGRVMGPDRDDLPVTAARALLKLDFEPRDHVRMHELAVKAQDGALTAKEKAELDAYESVGELLGLMHSLARRSLKRRNAAGKPRG